MRSWLKLGVWAVFCAVAAPVWSVQGIAQGASPDTARIIVTGEGVVEMVPDMAILTLGVTEEDPSAAEAMRAASQAAGRILVRLDDAGVAARDMQTSDLSVQPLWSDRESSQGQEPAITGYAASNQITVRLRDLAAVGDILDGVLDDGANRFGGLRFDLADSSEAQNEARRRSVADARARARLYAQAAGVVLGPVLLISETGGSVRPPPMMADMSMARSAVPMAAGELEIRAQVTMWFAIAE